MKRILAVDDNLVSLREISALLAGRYATMLARSGEQGLVIAAQQLPDLILLDVEMPGMNGFNVIASLRKQPVLTWIPVIFLTAHSDVATEIRALESGAVDFITKPVKKDILLHRIELHLQFAQYQRHMEGMATELEDSIIASFADIINCRGISLNRHEDQVGGCLNIICRALLASGEFAGELDEALVHEIIRGAPLHDIGKIGISDTILLKPGKLSVEEYEAVKEHTLIGGKVLQRIYEHLPTLPYLRCAALMAEGHHERFDGQGYPYGLAGEDIPLCSRILSVGNVYASLMSDCAFRKAMSHEEACSIILAGSGTAFDPRVVRAFEKSREAIAACKG